MNADEAVAFLENSHREYDRSRLRTLRWLFWWYVALAIFNFVLVFTVSTAFQLIPAFFCVVICVFAWRFLRSHKRSMGENL